ncbi:4-hydroxy-3-methylbut-2-en-1-yl diphosphate synthase (ferredoxin), chloroplastic, partial [Linum perenne]
YSLFFGLVLTLVSNAPTLCSYNIPIVADIHFAPSVALRVAECFDKIRVNPGNFGTSFVFLSFINFTMIMFSLGISPNQVFTPLVEKCKKYGRAMRIGTNHGSLSDRIMSYYGDSPQGMVESAFEFARICRKLDYHNFVFSMKASNPVIMVQAYRRLVAEMNAVGWDYPLHLGVTEAGEGEDGRMKSAIGIGTLLQDGLGDTIRVSLTEAPEEEIDPCKRLANLGMKAAELQEYVSCPSCGRTLFDLQEISAEIREKTSHLPGVSIAIMGCIVNGPGEMADADFGYVGGAPGKIDLYVGKTVVRRAIAMEHATDALIDLIKEHGRWVDPPKEE